MKWLLSLLSATTFALALLATPSVGSAGAGHAGGDATSFASALGISITAVDPMLPFGEAARREVSKATDSDPECLAEAKAWVATQSLADGTDRILRVGRLPYEGRGEEDAVLVALDEDHRFVAAAVLDQDGEKIESWQHFLVGLERATPPRIEGAKPRSHLDRVREKAQADGDDQGRLIVALLDFLKHMQDQAGPDEVPARLGRDGVAEAAARADAFRRAAGVTQNLVSLLGDRATEFSRLAKEAGQASDALGAAIGAGDEAAANVARNRLRTTCTSCHRLELPELQTEVKPAFQAAREELGIGDGYYVLGHDLALRHTDREEAQALADRLRQVVLLLDLANSW